MMGLANDVIKQMELEQMTLEHMEIQQMSERLIQGIKDNVKRNV